jgi:alkanesulfonate monooxygenase SsuD/methylene tetrahydromethanopterin reductase-like flavin-dependent oxidoreductase (luciferase family)
MRLGIIAPEGRGQPNLAVLRAAAAAAEQLGYSSVWMVDRLDALDPFAALADWASRTSRIRLGISLLVAPWYEPPVLARSLTSIDLLSEGRLVVGLGLDPGQSAQRGSTADCLEALLDELDTRRRGHPDEPRPAPPRRPPVLLAASTPAGLDLVARRADGWHPSGIPLTQLAAGWAELRDRAAGHGRDPDCLQLVVRADLAVRDSPEARARPAFCGSVDQIVDDVEAVRAMGAHEVVLAAAARSGFDEALDAYARVAEVVTIEPVAGG